MYFWIIIIAALLLDQGTKLIVKNIMELNQSIPVIENIFHLTYIENPGAAFGMLANKTGFFIITTLVIIGIMIYLYRQLENKKSLLAMSFALVIGGALGNFFDRLIKGTVTDFFDFRIWPIFNIADICVVVGLAYISYRLIFHGEDF